jgi:cephalosporin hydroxylase
MQLLNDLISSKEYRSYLEIGVGSKDTFDKIVIEQKECVDPDPRCKATHVVTSNKFFETCGHRTWDLIFIDGLHIADQVKQDIRNSLKHLNKGGTIVLHDCLPPDEDAQAIPPKKLVWTGDVWKAWSWYRMHEPNLNMYVVDIDFGCGVIEEGTQKCFPETEEVLDYKFFTENRTKLMNVVAWKDWKKMLKTPVMENSLNMPVRKLLQVMQDRILGGTSYLGIPTFKNPLDFWVYQEIIHETQPDFIIEIGNGHGGALLALAHLCDNIQKGKVIGIDLSHKAVPNKVKEHPRIALISGDAIEQFELTKRTVYGKSILVIEDSSHAYQNTLDLLRTYSKLLKSGNYYIVEDGICHHGLDVGPSPGPYEAIKTFLEENKEFESDRARESFLVTWNINGYIRKI